MGRQQVHFLPEAHTDLFSGYRRRIGPDCYGCHCNEFFGSVLQRIYTLS